MPNISKKDKVLFMYNPSSGKGKIEKNLDIIMKAITEKFGSCDVIRTKSKEHLQEIVDNACREHLYDYLLFSGGDGTFNMVVNAIPDIKDLPIFGYLPGGSTNDMSYNLNISKNPRKGIYDLINSEPKRYNVGYIGNNKFIYVSDFGVFTDVSHITPADAKRKFGVLAYVYYGIKSAFKIRTYKIIVDGVIYKTPLMIISNSREVASFKINPEKEQNDNTYYICIAKDGFMKGLFSVVHLFAFGIQSAYRAGKVEFISASNFVIDSKDEIVWDVDGEKVTVEFPTTCGYSGRSIKVLSNRK